MKNKFTLISAVVFVALATIISCKKTSSSPVLSLTNQVDTIAATGGSKTISFSCNDAWSIDTTGFGWLKISPISGNAGEASIQINVTDTNATGASRSKLIYLSSANGQSRRVTVYQYALIYPTYNTSPIAPDATGMSSTAPQLIAKLNLGVNIGNTLELNNIQPYPTLAYIQFLKQTGFNAVRIPCGWYLHGGNNPTAKIPQAWMDSVKQVVQWCVSNDMYVLLNIHWDGGWLESYGLSAAKMDSVNARQKAYWEQIATAMRNFDEHLIFASTNEPYSITSDATAKILLSYHQSCINAVRSTGGHNTYRTIAIQGPDNFINPNAYWPTDPTPNRLAFEFHNYTPSNFTILNADPSAGGWGYIWYYWGSGNHSTIDSSYRNASSGEESDQLAYYAKLKANYVDKGIPLLLGEYAANRRSPGIAWQSPYYPLDMVKHNNSVDAWYTYTTKQCFTIGAKPFFWETGSVFDRKNNAILDQRTVDAVKKGAQ